jgi:2-polyprenyl-3-methyl-5-hydroxy-6-metoxy-1,4-benzoquinol methylase
MNKTGNNHPSKKIGNVNITFNANPDEIKYFDGAEAELLKVYQSRNPSTRINEILSNNPSWPMIYHLSSKRGSLLDWYDFKPGSSVLEIGAGCGAITEALLKKDIMVTALEIDPMRALVNATRNKKSSNLEVIVENLQSFKPQKKFDYIVCIGVLEYSGKYISGSDPYGSFLNYMRSLLDDQGSLLLAIENKLGLKYIAGAPEDHTGEIFDSLNNYPNSIGIKTFSRNELCGLLTASGFSSSYFFFPHPDYKLPHCVFSDDLYPGKGLEFPLGLLPTPTPEKRLHLFSEQTFAMTLETENLYPFFANSFLVEARATSEKRSEQKLAYFGQVDRKDSMAITTTFVREKEGLKVKKKACSPAANKHLENMEKQGKSLKNNSKIFKIHTASSTFKNTNEKEKLAELSYPYIEGSTLERKLLGELQAGNIDNAVQIIKSVISIIDSFEKKYINPAAQNDYNKIFGNYYNSSCVCIYPGIIDLNLDNFISSDKTLHLIDYEWIFPFHVPVDYVLGRMLLSFFMSRYSDILRRNFKSLNLVEPFPGMVIPKEILELTEIKSIDFKLCRQTDISFQAYVGKLSQTKTKTSVFTPANIGSVDSYISFFDHVAALDEKVKYLQEHLDNALSIKDQEIQRLNEENSAIPIRGYKKIKRNIKKLRPR